MKKKPNWLNKIENKKNYIKNEIVNPQISYTIKSTKQILEEQIKKLNRHFMLSKNTNEALREIFQDLNKKKETFKASSAWEKTIKVLQATQKTTLIPIDAAVTTARKKMGKRAITGLGVVKMIEDKSWSAVITAWRKTRKKIKIYFAPENADELLKNTKEELIYINMCILQISKSEADKMAKQFNKALASKLTGAGVVGGLFALVSAFGTAGTGTAIANLSGVAATNATLAWIGGIIGGGMAAGTVLTGGLSVLIGIGAYKYLSSASRKIEDLNDEEKRIIESTGLLIAAIDEELVKRRVVLSRVDAENLLSSFLLPLQTLLEENKTNICENLDHKYQLLFEEHALVDFEGIVIDGFRYWIDKMPQEEIVNQSVTDKPINTSAVFVLGGLVYSLLKGDSIPQTVENEIALDALRRMKSDWEGLSTGELSDALQEYDADQLKGILSNAKGIYHELLFVDQFNQSHKILEARVFENTNHAGADIQIVDAMTGEVRKEAQLKALQDQYGIAEHFERYPDIEVIATSEVASLVDGVESSGMSNQEITEQMGRVLNDLSGNSAIGDAIDVAAISGLVSIGKNAVEVLLGSKEISGIGTDIVRNVSVATGSALVASWIFS
jgi:hypothetical protein